MPLCGAGDVKQAARMRMVPIWVFHGALDDGIPCYLSRDMVSALRKTKGNVRYTEYPDCCHPCWDRVYSDWQQLLPWFFSQRRRLPAK